MPAPAVIPAPIAYIKIVAVKKLVVGFLVWCARSAALRGFWCVPLCACHLRGRACGSFTGLVRFPALRLLL